MAPAGHMVSNEIPSSYWGIASAAGREDKPWQDRIPGSWGGHIKARGKTSFAEAGSFLAPSGTDTLVDGSAEFRLKYELELNNTILFTAHYENLYSGGDTRRGIETLERSNDLSDFSILPGRTISDDRRLLDLTSVLDEDSGHIWYHRLDRLFISYNPEWGNIRVGRQAVTWGNGLLFNPMDLFNPFSPADVERDYKIGDDMLSLEIYSGQGALQLLYVPRRNPESEKISWNHSSLAGKYHFMTGNLEFDLMAGYHYGDIVTGLGLSGYLGNAAWRMSGVVTLLDNESTDREAGSGTDGYLAMVANLDYSWIWGGKNFYGFLEFYHNSLLENNYAVDAFTPAVSERIARGELHTLGNTYLAANLQFEAHPLVNFFLTGINNLADPSGILQPRVIYDAKEDFRITVGADLYWGKRGSEFGGWEIPGAGLSVTPANSLYLWMTRFF